jgi:hypothetical protein
MQNFPPIEDDFVNEFGGIWHDPKGQGETLVGTFEDKAYAQKLAGYFEKHRIPYTLNEQEEPVTITVTNLMKILESAFVVCDKFHKPENAHVTVKGLLERMGPEQGGRNAGM